MNTIYMFADNTTVVGRISNNDESEYRKEKGLVTCYNENNLSLNVSKTKELIINLRKKAGEHDPIYINRAEVERVENITFLGMTITNNLSWTSHVDAMVKKGQQRLFLRRFRKFDISIKSLTNFYRCTNKSILQIVQKLEHMHQQ
eukprot:g23376.t1